MGSGSWTTASFVNYATTRGYDTDSRGVVTKSYSNQEMFKSKELDSSLNPKNVVRECCDSKEHPNTVPVILALDVTGSMGQAAVEISKKLNNIMTKLYEQVEDIEFMVMGIGDLSYDRFPIQASQFESDIRIAEQLEKVYFEFGGGGNSYESYTAAWYFGARHTKLDCWNRGKKGIIITIGDERLNPYLPRTAYYCGLSNATGDSIPVDVELEEKEPPRILYHGTGEKYIASIDQNGLIPKSRLYVHLSKDVETAKAVGKRHGKEVVYSINSEQMYKDGYKFYLSKNGVWLTKRVPVKYLMKEV